MKKIRIVKGKLIEPLNLSDTIFVDDHLQQIQDKINEIIEDYNASKVVD